LLDLRNEKPSTLSSGQKQCLAIAAATECLVERRTMLVLDYGKLPATFVDTQTGQAIRIRPHPDCRENAQRRLPNSLDRWHAQFEAYQMLPDEQLLIVEPVQLAVSIKAIISHPGMLAFRLV
jgi:formylmethanofuran dehydrogenase subunit E